MAHPKIAKGVRINGKVRPRKCRPGWGIPLSLAIVCTDEGARALSPRQCCYAQHRGLSRDLTTGGTSVAKNLLINNALYEEVE
jgi:hypothetical protein